MSGSRRMSPRRHKSSTTRVASIRELTTPVDLFLHDSDHSVRHERAEFAAVELKLAPGRCC